MPRRTNPTNSERRVVVRQYGGTIRLWPAEANTTLDQMTDLRNALITIEQSYRTAVANRTAEDPRIAAIDATLTELDTRIESLLTEQKRLRRGARTRKLPEFPDVSQQLHTASSLRRSLRAQRKEVAKVVREKASEYLATMAQERSSAIVAARRQSAKAGLYWGNYNEIIARFESASLRARKTGGKLRPAHHGGDGTLTVQVMPPVPTAKFPRGAEGWTLDVFPPTPPPQTAVRPPAAWLRPYTDCRGKPRALAGLTVVGARPAGGSPVQVVLDIAYHRPLPTDADVAYVRLTRRRAGGRWVHTISFTCRSDLVVEPASGATVGIDVGFRRLPEGLRVAVAAFSGGSIETLVLPEALLARHAAIADRQGRLDDAVNAMWRALLAESDALASAPDPLVATWAAELQRQSTGARLTHMGLFRLRAAWPQDWRADLRSKLDDWAFRRARARSGLEAFRNRTARWGRELRRVWVANLVKRAGHVVIPDIDIRRMTRRIHPDGTENSLALEHRRLAGIAAPGHLLAWIATQAVALGVTVTRCSDRATWVCHICGLEHAPTDAGQLIHRCRGCGTSWDQDYNAARNRVAALRRDP